MGIKQPKLTFSGALFCASVPLLSIGSGGSSFSHTHPYSYNTTTTQQIQTPQKIEKIQGAALKDTIEQQKIFIKETFDLTDQEIAEILGVERKTLHNWVHKDRIPKAINSQNYFMLYLIAQGWHKSLFPTNEALKSTLSQEQRTTLLQNLKSFNSDKVMFIGRNLLRTLDSQNSLM